MDNPFVDGMIAGLMMSVVVLPVRSYIAAKKDGSFLLSQPPGNMVGFLTPLPADAVFRSVLSYAQKYSYKIEGKDEAGGRVLLGRNMRMFTSGMHWLVFYVLPHPNGGTSVQIGSQLKMMRKALLPQVIHAERDKAMRRLQEMLVAVPG